MSVKADLGLQDGFAKVAAAGEAVNEPKLLAVVGLEPHDPWNPKAMIPAEPYYTMLERLAARVDPTDLPVRVGAVTNASLARGQVTSARGRLAR